MAAPVRHMAIRNSMIYDQPIMERGFLAENREALIREREQYEEYLSKSPDSDDPDIDPRLVNVYHHEYLESHKKSKVAKQIGRLRVWDAAAGVLGILGLILAFVELEENYSSEDKGRYELSSLGNTLRSFVLITTILLLICIYKHYHLSYIIGRERNTTIGTGSSFLRSVFFKKMWVELGICIIHCPPGVEHTFNFEQLNGTLTLSVDDILTSLMMLRVYLGVRLIRALSKYSTPSSEEICINYGFVVNDLFVMKAIFKERPNLTLFLALILSIIVFGMTVRVYERPYSVDNNKGMDFGYAWNAFWMIVITMMTVGYGDFYPGTHVGRFIVIIACFWGVFIVSMMIVNLVTFSQFERRQSRAYGICNMLREKKVLRTAQITAITRALEYNLYLRVGNQAWASEKRFDMIMAVNQLRAIRANAKESYVPTQELLKRLSEKIDVDLSKLRSLTGNILQVHKKILQIENGQSSIQESVSSSMNHLLELEMQLKVLEIKDNTL